MGNAFSRWPCKYGDLIRHCLHPLTRSKVHSTGHSCVLSCNCGDPHVNRSCSKTYLTLLWMIWQPIRHCYIPLWQTSEKRGKHFSFQPYTLGCGVNDCHPTLNCQYAPWLTKWGMWRWTNIVHASSTDWWMILFQNQNVPAFLYAKFSLPFCNCFLHNGQIIIIWSEQHKCVFSPKLYKIKVLYIWSLQFCTSHINKSGFLH